MSNFHYIPKQISSVDSKDSRISLVGNVVGVDENSFILDDTTGKIEILSDKKIDKNKLVRVFCSVMEDKLKADTIQNLEGLDIDLFKKINELYIRAGV